jgi:hypothetical protein
LKDGEHVRLIRAFNVLRQYEEKDFAPAYERLAEYVLPGGLMIEGTSNPFGSIWCANIVRKTSPAHVTLREGRFSATTEESRRSPALRAGASVAAGSSPASAPGTGVASLRMTNAEWLFEALVFSTNFRLGFDITDFQAVLPKNLIHRVVSGEPIHGFFEAWKAAAAETAAMKVYGLRQWFIHSAEALAQKGYKINLQKKFLSRGYLIWEL